MHDRRYHQCTRCHLRFWSGYCQRCCKHLRSSIAKQDLVHMNHGSVFCMNSSGRKHRSIRPVFCLQNIHSQRKMLSPGRHSNSLCDTKIWSSAHASSLNRAVDSITRRSSRSYCKQTKISQQSATGDLQVLLYRHALTSIVMGGTISFALRSTCMLRNLSFCQNSKFPSRAPKESDVLGHQSLARQEDAVSTLKLIVR